jgi:hypothetical protein
MTIKSVLEQAVSDGRFSIESARSVIQCDWRNMIRDCPAGIEHDAETLFYFIEGFVEDIDEGYVVEREDHELYTRILELLNKLQAT